MKVKVTKSGLWSEKGIKNVPVEASDKPQEMHQDLAKELIEAGWAEEFKEVEKKVEKPKKDKKKAKK